MDSCLKLAEAGRKERRHESSTIVTSIAHVPTDDRILATVRLLFPHYDVKPLGYNQPQSQNDVSHSTNTISSSTGVGNDGRLVDMPPKFEKMLRHLVFAFAMLNNLQECREVPLNVYGLPKYRLSGSSILTAQQAFDILAILLLDRVPEQQELDRAAVVSCWGWSLCIGSILNADPGDIRADLAIKRGVPARNKERKEWIMDHPSGLTWTDTINEDGDLNYEISACPGDRDVRIDSFMEHSNVRYLVATTDIAFQVYTIFTCGHDPKSEAYAYCRLGFRYMQYLYWSICPLPQCEHGVQRNEYLTIPQRCLVFKGLLDSLLLETLESALASSETRAEAISKGKIARHVLVSSEAPGQELAVEANETTLGSMLSQPLSSSGHNTPSKEITFPDKPPLGSTRIQTPTLDAQTFEVAKTVAVLNLTTIPWIHISRSVSNVSSRWILLAKMQKFLRDGPEKLFEACYLKNRHSCIDCALQYIREDLQDRPKPYGALALSGHRHITLVT